MDQSSFWLIHIDNSYVTVGLAQSAGDRVTLASIGTPSPWTSLDPDSIVKAADQSLSESSGLANLADDAEPDNAAFIVNPNWIGSDGKISPPYLKHIELICRKLDLKPMGFIADDEAILESSNSADGLPVSFILLSLNPISFDVTLVYLGKIKERQHRDLPDGFTPQNLELALTELQTDSTLPPQIIVFGHYSPEIIENLKNFSWVGKKNIETFLHFPDIVSYSTETVFNIYLRVIHSQFHPQSNKIIPSTAAVSDEDVVVEEAETGSDTASADADSLTVVPPDSLGFAPPVLDEPQVIAGPSPPPPPDADYVPEDDLPPAAVPAPILPQIKFKPPRVHLKFKFSRLLMIILAASPLLIIIPYLLLTARVTIFVSPFQFDKTIAATLDPNITAPSGSSLPVKLKTINLNLSASVPTTGQKIIGDNARGDITIFNQATVVENLPKGTILTSDKGLKFALSNPVQVAASTANFDTGIITMGQTKATVIAADIGPEYNLTKDTKLTISNFNSSQMLAKVAADLTGGTKQQIQAVAAADKTAIDTQINQQITASLQSKTNTDIQSVDGVLASTVNIRRDRIDYSREIGEQADTLTATSSNTITVFYLDSSVKPPIAAAVFASDPNFSQADVNLDQFTFDFVPSPGSADKTKGQLSIKGSALPHLDLNLLQKQLAGKLKSTAGKIIRNFSPRIYNYSLNFYLNPLPFVASHINIDIK